MSIHLFKGFFALYEAVHLFVCLLLALGFMPSHSDTQRACGLPDLHANTLDVSKALQTVCPSSSQFVHHNLNIFENRAQISDQNMS
jgi:hypothetical protein